MPPPYNALAGDVRVSDSDVLVLVLLSALKNLRVRMRMRVGVCVRAGRAIKSKGRSLASKIDTLVRHSIDPI
jgi:hypothetical protein